MESDCVVHPRRKPNTMSKPKNLRITVPKPCHEDWHQMTPQQRGRFCSSCSKVVMDFSRMSDQQLIEFFQKDGGKTCGRFTNEQLNRPIPVPPPENQWRLPRIAYASVISMFTAIGSALASHPIELKPPLEQHETQRQLVDKYSGKPFTISGTVTHDGRPVSGVTVSAPTWGVETVTDESGHYELTAPNKIPKEGIRILYRLEGYQDVSHLAMRNNEVIHPKLKRALCAPKSEEPRPMMGEPEITTGIPAMEMEEPTIQPEDPGQK